MKTRSGEGLKELLDYIKDVSPEVLAVVPSNKVTVGSWRREGDQILASPEIHLTALAMVVKATPKNQKPAKREMH